jgi:hypothetical protein
MAAAREEGKFSGGAKHREDDIGAKHGTIA